MPTRRLAALLCLTLAACGDKDPPGEGGLDSGDSGGGGSDTAGGAAPAPRRSRSTLWAARCGWRPAATSRPPRARRSS
jgi:hypothetical protein